MVETDNGEIDDDTQNKGPQTKASKNRENDKKKELSKRKRLT